MGNKNKEIIFDKNEPLIILETDLEILKKLEIGSYLIKGFVCGVLFTIIMFTLSIILPQVILI